MMPFLSQKIRERLLRKSNVSCQTCYGFDTLGGDVKEPVEYLR